MVSETIKKFEFRIELKDNYSKYHKSKNRNFCKSCKVWYNNDIKEKHKNCGDKKC